MTEKLIRIANDWALVRREKQLSDIARKIEAYLIWMVEFDGDDLPEVEINVDILMRCGLKRHDLDARVQEVAEELLSYIVHFIQPDGKWGKTTLCSSFKQADNGYIVRMDKDLKPFFLELKKNFAQFSIHPLLAVGRSSYSHHLYQYLRTKIHAGNLKAWCRIKIEDLKGLLGCLDLYNRWDDFDRRVLRPAIKEISSETDLLVTYKAESGPKGKAKKTILFEITQQEYQGILFDLNDNPVDEYYSSDLSAGVLKACEILTFKPIGKSKEILLRAIKDYSEEILIESLNSLQNDWKEASASVRGGVVHKLLPSYLKRSEEAQKRLEDLSSKLQDREMAEGALMAEKAKYERLAKEYTQNHKLELYDSLDESTKRMFSYEDCPIMLLEGVALDIIRSRQKT